MTLRWSRLARSVTDLERSHPEWNARRIEKELEILAPVDCGTWREQTPNLEARLRQIQRWRAGGAREPRGSRNRPQVQIVWPVGERQRRETDPAFQPRDAPTRASHRLFLYNCTAEAVREVRIRLGGRQLSYEPLIGPGTFVEVPWFGSADLRAALLDPLPTAERTVPLEVSFAVRNGARLAQLRGELTAHVSHGWSKFRSAEGDERAIY